MRHGSLVTIIFADGQTVRGQLGNMKAHPPQTMRVGGFGPFSHEVQTGSGKIELEILGPEEIQRPSPPLPTVAPSVPETEDPNWGRF